MTTLGQREAPGHFFERDPGLHALRLLAERFCRPPARSVRGAMGESDWMIRNVLGLIAAMLMIGAASAAPREGSVRNLVCGAGLAITL